MVEKKHLLDSWKQQRAARVNKALSHYGIVFAILATATDLYFNMPWIVLAGDVAMLMGIGFSLVLSRKQEPSTWAWAPLYTGLWLSIVTSLMVSGGVSSPFIGGYLTLLYVAGLVLQIRVRPLFVTLFIFGNFLFWLLAEAIYPSGFSIFPPPVAFSFIINGVMICALMICVYEFLRTEQTLADEIIKRYKELAIAQDNLSREEAANATKTTFLANISHELRTPLGAILGYADLILDAPSTESERKSFAETIRNNGHQLLHLVDDLLDLTKVEAGKIEIEKQTFNPMDTLTEVIELLNLSAQKKSLDLILVTKNAPPSFVSSDPLRLRQILMNVIGNAIKFCEKGRVQITVNYDSTKPQLILEILDTGPGLSPEEQARLFKPFGQADVSITRKYGGSGLGLNLSRHLARLLGGDLELEWSQPGLGSRFSLKIPAPAIEIKMENTLPGLSNRSKQLSKIPSGKCVLIVEDNADNQNLISRYLLAADVKIELASDGLEAIQKISMINFDLVLMDVQMPILDGLKTTRLLRQKQFSKPIIALTAHAMKEDRERCLTAGFNDYLTKPIDRALLIDKIKYHLNQANSQSVALAKSADISI